MEAQIDLPLACYLAQVFRFFIVTLRKFMFSLEYVENEERLIAAKTSDAYNIVSPI